MTPAHQEAVRSAILAATKGRTPDELAQRANVHARTVQRFLAGKTFGWGTAAALAKALRVDLDSVAPQVTQEHVGARKITQDHAIPSPVVGWKSAAAALGISHDTLQRRRRLAGSTREAWWASAEALLRWYESLLLGVPA